MVHNILESQDQFNIALDKALAGKYSYQGQIKEALTSDQFAPLFYGATQPVFEEFYDDLRDEQIWSKLATSRDFNDFRPQQLLELQPDSSLLSFDNAGGAMPEGTLPVVPELTPYPTFGYKAGGKWIEPANKHGARIQFSFEAFINDQWDVIEQFPAEAAKLASHTVDVAVLALIYSGTGTFNASNINDAYETVLKAHAATPDAFVKATAKNAPLSYDAVWNAIDQVTNTKRPNGVISVPNGWYLVVPPALKQTGEFILQSRTVEITRSDEKFTINRSLGDVELLVTEWAADMGPAAGWALIPKGGRTSKRLTLLKTGLRGYTTPDLRFKDAAGRYIGGGDVPFTDGSFDNDDAQVRVRNITGGAVVNTDGIIASDGTGS